MRTIKLTRRTGASLAVIAAIACAAAPAQAQSQSQAAQRAQMVEAYGGVYGGPLASYVAQVGNRVAGSAGRRPGDCTFEVINSPVVNAFAAAPGCNVFITRGLISILNSEGELAAVLGHEVGHVAANHAGKRQQRSTLAGLGALLVGAVTRNSSLGQLAGQAAQLNVLGYSRDQEYEADTLGVRYLQSNGYSPYSLADMLGTLQSSDQLEARTRNRPETQSTPAWARTHPLTGERIVRAVAEARKAGPANGPAEPGGPYFSAIDGMLFGDDPSQGFVEGRSFVHPSLGIGFTVPQGFAMTNGTSAVKIEGPGGLSAQFGGGRSAGGSLDRYASDVLRQLVGQSQAQVGRIQSTRINGLEAVVLPARARSQNGVVDVTVAAYALGNGSAYHFVTLAPAGRSAVFDPMIGSFQRLTEAQSREARPRRLDIVTVRTGETVQSLAARMAFEDFQQDRFRALNGLEPGEQLRPGQRVKIVVAGASRR